MSILTDAGKIAFFTLLKDSTIHFGFGLGASTWGTAGTKTSACPNDYLISLSHSSVSSVVVTNLTNASDVGTEGTPETPNDYYVDYALGKITLTPSFAAIGNSIRIDYRYGKNAESAAATDLIDRKINKLCVVKNFVTPDAGGAINVNGTRFTESLTPTTRLYLVAWLEPEEYPNGTVKELGIFVNPTVVAGLPEGRLTFTPEQITAPGSLVLLANYPLILRNAASRIKFHHILTLP